MEKKLRLRKPAMTSRMMAVIPTIRRGINKRMIRTNDLNADI